MAVASRPASEPAPGPESESNAGPGRLMSYELSLRKFSLTLQPSSHDSPRWRGSLLPRSGRGLSPCARNTIREAISRDTRSSQPSMYAAHAARRNRTRNAAGTFSRSAEDLQTEKCGWPNLSTRRQRAARPTPRSHEPSGHTLTLDPPCLQGRHRLRNTTYYGRPPLTGLGRNFLPFEILRDETAREKAAVFSPADS